MGALGAYLVGSVALFIWSRWRVWLLVAVPGVVGVAYWCFDRLATLYLLTLVRHAWRPRGIRCLVVYSESPLWAEHVRGRWLSQLGGIAEVLNCSQGPSGTASLAVRVYHRFCGRRWNYNPAIVVFRGLRQPLVFRFFYAFQEAKHGRPQYVAELERDAFAALQIPAMGGSSQHGLPA